MNRLAGGKSYDVSPQPSHQNEMLAVNISPSHSFGWSTFFQRLLVLLTFAQNVIYWTSRLSYDFQIENSRFSQKVQTKNRTAETLCIQVITFDLLQYTVYCWPTWAKTSHSDGHTKTTKPCSCTQIWLQVRLFYMYLQCTFPYGIHTLSFIHSISSVYPW